MDSGLINNRLKDISRRQKRLSEEIMKEYMLLEKLKQDDPSWSSFLRRMINVETPEQVIMDKKEYLRLKEEKADYSFFDRVKDKLDSIPESNGSRLFAKIDKQVAVIADEFLFKSFDGVTNLNYVTPDNYKEHLGSSDMLLVASTWRGIDQEWKGTATPNSKKREVLFQVIKAFKATDIPVVFFNKEDPVNFERFIDIAKQCDYVFTTASEKVDDYKKICGHSRVYVIAFSANPLYHNPIGMFTNKKEKDILFAGSWYYKYPNRQQDTQMIFDGIVDSGHSLKILDRNFNLNNMDYAFPEKYLSYISPAISHNYIQKLHKLYNWSINLNSVVTSPTMIANRVYELQAIGNNIISNYSPSINNKFQNVFLVTNKYEVGAILNSMSDEEVYQHQVKGIRGIMSKDTSYHRLQYIFETIGIDYQVPEAKVLVVADELNTQVTDSFEKQTYEKKRLITKDQLTAQMKKSHDTIAFFDKETYYNHYYLNDLVTGFVYTDSDFITKSAKSDNKAGAFNYTYTEQLENKSTSLLWSNAFELDELLEEKVDVQSQKGFTIDHFEYSADSKEREKIQVKKDYKLSIIVPVYNNGIYLEDKCFKSLKRSSIFDQMEIILVDDGSTDEHTKLILGRLYNEYSNVKLYTFDDTGSGSASRPRNKGIEFATTDYITYLDPDNEAVNDGYAILLKELEANPSLDLVVGNILRLNKNIARLNYYSSAIKASNGSELIDDTQELLRLTSLKAQSIQALIVKKSIIVDNNLKMVENSAGQDTLFFQQLLMHTDKIKVKNLDIHIYYAEVANSVTNTITKRFFQKYLKLEKERYKFLTENNLLDLYMAERFNFYFKNWYFLRVAQIKDSDLEDGLNILYEIFKIYKPHIKQETREQKLFYKSMKRKQYESFRDHCVMFFGK